MYNKTLSLSLRLPVLFFILHRLDINMHVPLAQTCDCFPQISAVVRSLLCSIPWGQACSCSTNCHACCPNHKCKIPPLVLVSSALWLPPSFSEAGLYCKTAWYLDMEGCSMNTSQDGSLPMRVKGLSFSSTLSTSTPFLMTVRV